MLDSKYLASMQIHYDGTFKYKFTVSNWVSALRLVSQGKLAVRQERFLLLFPAHKTSSLSSSDVFYSPQFSYSETARGIRRKDQQDLGGDRILLDYTAAKPHGGAVE